MATQHIDDLHVSSNTIGCCPVAREISPTEPAAREPRAHSHAPHPEQMPNQNAQQTAFQTSAHAEHMPFPNASDADAPDSAMTSAKSQARNGCIQ